MWKCICKTQKGKKNGIRKKEDRYTEKVTIGHRMSHVQMIALGYFLVIVSGSLLLMLPQATRPGLKTTYLEALFTATSATCVTGLAVVDTASHWSLLGQMIILAMIQVGGLGFMTIGVMFAMGLKRSISLKVRGLLQESMNSIQLGGVVKMARYVVKGTIIVEGIGALLLMCVFIPRFGVPKGIYYGIFHAISAFCNGGFDVLGTEYEPYCSFCFLSDDILLNVVIMFLITVGSIGFFVWKDILEHKLSYRKYSLHSKLAISTTVFIFIISSILFYLFERDGLMKGMGLKETLLASLFSSITPRTAGFNTIDTGALSNSSLMLTLVLMFIGGSPASTAGGIKTVTLSVMIIYVWSNLRSKTGCNVYGRRIPDEAIKKASNVIMINLMLAVAAVLVISYCQPLNLRDVLFEVFSAIGTAGMTTGVTRSLTTTSRIVIILLMFCGRIGSMSFALSFTQRDKVAPVRLPEENIIIG